MDWIIDCLYWIGINIIDKIDKNDDFERSGNMTSECFCDMMMYVEEEVTDKIRNEILDSLCIYIHKNL